MISLDVSLQNETKGDNFISDIQSKLNDSKWYWFFLSIFLAQIWVIFLTFYNSRVTGLIMTAVINKFVKLGHIKLGAFSFSVLSGKIMFRDVHIITEDFTIRIQYGWIIFKWWRPYIPKTMKEDLSHSESRVAVFLDDLEFHIYNRSGNYSKLEKLFSGKSETVDEVQDDSKDKADDVEKKRAVTKKEFVWRDLIPVIKVQINSGRVIFGNHLVPNSMIVKFDDGNFVYTTKPASTPFDVLMHDARGKAENFKIMFVPSPKYNGPVDEPPRNMGEGFVVLQTREINVHFFMDEPGTVPYEPESVQLADGETIVLRTYPCLSVVAGFGKNTDFNYGPWADRQRELLWKFFYPADYQDMVPTIEPKPGELRQYKTFEFRMNMYHMTTIDILFTKNSETQAIHMNASPGSYIEMNVPWIVAEDGYVTTVKGQFLLADATTSLQYRSLIECETFEFTVKASYPMTWNDHQDWVCDFIACKATVFLIFHLKHFFKDLMEDWSSTARSDIFHFVPYTWTINLIIKEFELVLLTNEYNWIDTSSSQTENAHIAFCGQTMELSLVLPYTDYLPPTVHVGLVIKGENAYCRFYLPETNTSRHIVQAISKNMKLMDRNGQIINKPFQPEKPQWRRFTLESDGWLDCWTTTHVSISLGYTYHPMPILTELQPDAQRKKSPQTTPTIEEEILIPLGPMAGGVFRSDPPDDFDPANMEPDLIALELEVAPSMLCIYGPLLRNFLHLKENYLGEDQLFTDFNDPPKVEKAREASVGPLFVEVVEVKPFDTRDYRPFAVTVSLAIHDVHGHLIKNCNIDDLPCPSIFLERLCFEMDKNYLETKLQLLLSPAVLVAKDTFLRGDDNKHLNEGHLGLSGLQVRGHAMFSNEGLPIDSETLEYGWLVEAIIGDVTGKLTSPQLQNLIEFLQTFITLIEDPENCLTPAVSNKLCQHMLPQPQCRMLPQYSFQCPSSEDIKYVMTRVSMDSVNFFLVESGTALNVQLHPIKLSTCNLHGTNTRAGITARVEHISLTQFISSSALKHDSSQSDLWLESGGLTIGPIDAEAAMALPNPDFHKIQDNFLKIHDKKTKRLWFVWPPEEVRVLPIVKGRCGCLGGCAFFGNNRTGIGFFNSKRYKEKPFSAVLKVSPAGQDPGFGQSLLFKDKLVFEVSPTNGVEGVSPTRGNEFKFTRGYMSNLTSPESGANITVIEEMPPVSQTLLVPKDNAFQFLDNINSALSQNFVGDTSLKSVGSDSCLKDKNIFVPSGLSKSPEEISISSPSDSKSLSSRKDSIDNFSKRGSITSQQLILADNKSMNRKSGSEFEDFRKLSEKSLSKSSLPTPRILRQDMGSKVTSDMSLESERYFSADEDMEESLPVDEISFLSEVSLNSTLKKDEADLTDSKLNDQTVLEYDTLKKDRKPFVHRQRSCESSDSTLSYESAPTEPNDGDSFSGVPENFLVDLHGQVQKPISESPVLMSCYASHLTQYQCNDWSQSSPISYNRTNIADQSIYSLSSVGQSIQYVHSPACVPHFTKMKQGFTPSLMKTKEEYRTEEEQPENDSDSANIFQQTTENSLLEEDQESSLPENVSITTAVVKVRGCMNVMLTPLFLESFQRYAEAVIPTLTALHPSAIIDGLHSQCLDRLKRQNRLKKAKTKSDADPVIQVPDRQFSTETRASNGEMKTTSIQALFTLSKINICVLQSGMVEEVIAFQAMEGINDLTCVSLLAVCFDDINCQLLSNNQSVKTTQEKTSSVTAPMKTSPKKQKVKRTDSNVYERSQEDQVTEISREEDVGTLHISRVHIQLQRLLKNSNYSEEVLLTAIPEHKSKVLFEFDKELSKPLAFFFPVSPRQKEKGSTSTQSPKSVNRQSSREARRSMSRQSSMKDHEGRGGTLPKLFRQRSIDEESLDGVTHEAKPRKVPSREHSFRSGKSAIGFIMFECGLENIDVKAVRRLGFSENVDEQFTQKMEKVAKKLHNIQTSARIELERELGNSEDLPTPNKQSGGEAKIDNDSVHSWDSRVSIPSNSTSLISVIEYEAIKGDASSGVLEIKTIWLNFAAPPPISIKSKVDFTKHDWNLLSTGTPAINAWLNPLDRLIYSVKHLILALTHRNSSVMACIMTDGLEESSVHFPRKSKYYKITPLARILAEEPSCQLFTVLRKYLYKVGTIPVERAVQADTLPQLITIQKGILALTRQWKNVLYMPQLSEMDFKSQKTVRPYTVKFALPLSDEFSDDEDDDNVSEENFDIVDERVSLLTGDDSSIHKSGSVSSFHVHGRGKKDHAEGSSSMPSVQYKKLKSFSQPNDSPDTQDNCDGLTPNQPLAPPPSINRNDSNYSFHSAAASLTSVDKSELTPPPTPLKADYSKPSILKNNVNVDKTQDLYQWMAQQQDEFQFDDGNLLRRQDSLLGAFGSAWSQDDSRLDLNDELFSKATSIMQLADARSLFKPFLQSIGLHVEGVRPTAMMKKFGGSLSLQGQLEVIKIQIVNSERHHRRKEKSKKRRLIDFNAVPAFLCEGFLMHIAMKDVVDFENKESGSAEDKSASKPPLNFPMHKLEAKPTTLQVNFMMNCNSVIQHVDMPLLRLVHQFVTMVDNITDTKKELKQSHSTYDWVKTHRKQESKCSTSSADTQHSDISHSGLASPPSIENLNKFKESTSSSESTPGVPVIDVPSSNRKTSNLACIPINFPPKADQKRPERLTLPMKKPNIFQTKKALKTEPVQTTSGKPSDILTPPQSLNYSDSVTIDMEDTSSPIVAEKTIVDEIKESTPKCWRTLYHLLELYSTMPETKTILGRRPTAAKLLPVIAEEPEGGSRERVTGNLETPSDSIKMMHPSRQDIGDIEEKGIGGTNTSSRGPHYPPFSRTSFRQSIYVGESITLVVFGIAKVQTVRMQALLSGLKLEAEMKSVHASGSYKEKAKGFLHRKSSESSVTAHIGNTNIVLLEGLPPEIKTVVKVKIERSLGLHTTILRRGKEHNSAMVSVGAIIVDIPQHPVVLHGMVTRSSREISSTLLEFRRPMSRVGRVLEPMFESGAENQPKAEKQKHATKPLKRESTNKPTFLHIHIKAIMQGITIGASLLPSLKAQYKTDSITVSGITGKKAHFTLDLPNHALSFKSKVTTTETSIPSSASIDLPPIHMYADYRSYTANSTNTETLTEGLVWREGSYLNGVAEVGMLEHSLSTDLLNHLVFVQKVFMKEVNELVQKVSGTDQPVPLWVDEIETNNPTSQPMLYSLLFRFKGIQITATTPTSSAVRMETGSVDLEISNRVQMAKREDSPSINNLDNQKMFMKAQVDLNVALGQLIKNAMFEEAEPEFQTMAFFKTNIAIRNALQDEMIPGVSTDQEALLIKLTRPIILIQPVAFDKAVLVWLNYKNAYEYWTEQRMALNNEVQTATRQVMDRIPQFSNTAPTTFSTLYLQLTVDDMGICVPVESINNQQSTHSGRFLETEPASALVMTLKSTQISACSSGSLVSKGKFQGFCLRFANDFETSWDDWKPDSTEDPVMNACVVPEGTYEVCSRTITKQVSDGNAKWILNVQWNMKGIDVHLDTNIGKRLSALGGTLTALAGEPDEVIGEDEDGDQDMFSPKVYETEPSPRRPSLMLESLPSFVYDTTMDPKQRFRLIEKEMNEQARIVQDLRQLGASLSTIEVEARKLEELKSIVFRDFRREILFKLKKQGESRTSALKDQLGIGNKPMHARSKSYAGQHRISHADVDRLATFNQQYKRIGSLDVSNTLPARVKFGQTLSTAYSPPDTPTSLDESARTYFPPDTPTSLDESALLKNFMSDDSSAEARVWCSGDSTSSSGSSDITDDEFGVTNKGGDVFDESDGGIHSHVHNPSIGSGSSKSSTEPNIDFELDVKVFIDSGKCVLHPKDSKEDEQKRQQKREKTPTIETSPISSRKNQKKPDSVLFSGQTKKPGQPQQPQIENSVFFMPSVDVKVHYKSKTTSGNIDGAVTPETDRSSKTTSGNIDGAVTPETDRSTRDHLPREDPYDEEDVVVIRRPKSTNLLSPGNDVTDTSINKQKAGVKKAKLYAWLSLQSLPEEMIISPYLMDFLEQALEPIPIGQSGHTSTPAVKKMDPFSMLNIDLDASSTSLTTAINSNSFPVDVVVFIRVEPSIIRFNCTPVSRVECLLQVPSLDVAFSTRGSDVEAQIGETTPPLKTKGSRERNCSGGISDKHRTFSTTSSSNDFPVMSKAGGLSITGRLSDFSLYIFHPYGGAQRKMTSPTYASSDSTYKLGSIQEHGTAWSEMSRRDMLSLNVEFIKITISRTRKLEVRMDLPSHLSKHEPQLRSNVVRFSAVCDIGIAAFKYDMRRLSEILTFPKAWYNRNLTRRLFLGEESFANTGDEEWDNSSTSSMGDAGSFTPASKIFTSSPALNINTSDKKTRTHHRRGSSGDKFRTQLSMELKNEIDSQVNKRGSMSAPQSPTDMVNSDSGSAPITKPLSKHRASITPSETPRNKRRVSGTAVPKPSSSWETLVMFAVNLSQLDLRVNMSNVMGNTVWSTKNVKSQGRLSIDCSGHKDLKITAGMDNSHFDSKGGVVGGTLELNNLSTFFEVNEDPEIGKEPSHRLGFSLFAIECRMDYMGTSVLMTRLSKLDIELKDEWHVETKYESDTPLATTRPGFLFAHGEIGWDQFHIMISRSTTPDIFKMVAKIEEFITMQFTSGRRVLSAFGPIGSKRSTDRQKADDEDEYLWDIKHHRHWQKAFKMIPDCKFTMLPSTIPKLGTILGGNITLHGNNLTLACFHGINFRSKSWALFSLNEAFIVFATEAQKTQEGDIHIVQDLTLNVGRDKAQHTLGKNMATVCKISRGHTMPPTFTSVQEWFHYAFATSEIKDLDNFPMMQRNAAESPKDHRRRRTQEYFHDTEMIFVLPSLEMCLRSIHTQGEHEPASDDERTVVEVTFVTEFEDHIYVAMDAEVILFIHDLIFMYIKEKDKDIRMSYKTDSEKKKVTDPTAALKEDWREFNCKFWKLEPTVRLLHWASKEIDPVGVDYVLQKLGFTHARVTIPKWMQRGFMDPLDKFLSILIEYLITVLREKPKEPTEGES